MAAVSLVPRQVLGGAGHVPPSERLNVGIIGTGGQGITNLKELLRHTDVHVSAICDVAEFWDNSHLSYRHHGGRRPAQEALDEHSRRNPELARPKTAVHVDYRVMLERTRNDVDAVLIAAPNHIHAVAAVAAIRAGKGVYCEKPLTHSIDLYWYDGGLRPARPPCLEPDEDLPGAGGSLIVGDQGALLSGVWSGSPRLILEVGMREFQTVPASLPRSKGHHRDWIDACKGGPAASANFEYGARLTEIVLLGLVALRTGKTLHWDGPRMRASNAPEAEPFIRGYFRQGWEL